MPEPQDRDTVTQGDSVTPQRFARVRAIFEAAIERRAFAAGACAGDSDLLREVEAKLAADGQADRVLDRTPPPSSSPEEGRFPAEVLAGRYRILGVLSAQRRPDMETAG